MNNAASDALRERLQDIFLFGDDDESSDLSDSEDSDIPAIFTDEEQDCSDVESPVSPNEHAVFQDLPPELRILVCKSAVVNSEPVDLSKRSNHVLPRITQTSRFYRTEGTRLYYKLNTFLIPLPSGLTFEESNDLDRWLWGDNTTQSCRKMRKIVVQVSLSVFRRTPEDNAFQYGIDRVSFANLLHLAMHFKGLSSEKAWRIVRLQVFITTITGSGETQTSEQALATPDVVRQVAVRFWNMFDGSLRELGKEQYDVPWTDEEEMEGNHDIPLLERSITMGCINEELGRDLLEFWNEEQFPEPSEAQYLESID